MEENLKKLLFFGAVFIAHQADVEHVIEFIFITDLNLAWVDARDYCRTFYDDLATIADVRENDLITDMAEVLNPDGFWIGLHDDIFDWKWSLVSDDIEARNQTFMPWQENEPDNLNSAEHCVSMVAEGLWRDRNCMMKLPIICATDDESRPYVVLNKMRHWLKAQNYCRQEFIDLASVRSKSENQQVKNQLQNSLYHEAWIGLHREPWSWSDGSSSSFRQWRSNEPNNENNAQQCAAVQGDVWVDWNCNATFNFICQNKVPQSTAAPTIQEYRRTTVRMELLTESNLTDPTNRQEVLQQMKAALRLRGITGVKLLWTNLRPQTNPAHSETCEEETKQNLEL